ncbi:MAG TPA: TMEM43 family protein [Oleiagrimonas sp.]|nr:TMEM43 family protein [Oleiagrimonas sp.]
MTALRGKWIMVDIGLVLMLIGLAVLGVNEHSAADWQRGMARHGGSILVLGTEASPDAAQYGRRVLVTGTPQVVQRPRDPDFHVSADTSLLVRKVAMFQWREVRFGNQVNYQQDWVDHAVDSSDFEQPAGHANTLTFPFESARFHAAVVRLDGYVLAPELVHALPGGTKPLQPDFSHLPANLQASFRVRGNRLTTRVGDDRPRLGDLRVQWLVHPLQTVTVIARVDGNRLVPANGPGKGFRIQLGERSLTDIFPDLPLPPSGVWAWRVLALVLTCLGAWLALRQWFATRTAVPAALASGVAVLGVLAGIMWIATSVMIAVIAWVVAVLAAAFGGLCMRRRAVP